MPRGSALSCRNSASAPLPKYDRNCAAGLKGHVLEIEPLHSQAPPPAPYAHPSPPCIMLFFAGCAPHPDRLAPAFPRRHGPSCEHMDRHARGQRINPPAHAARVRAHTHVLDTSLRCMHAGTHARIHTAHANRIGTGFHGPHASRRPSPVTRCTLRCRK